MRLPGGPGASQNLFRELRPVHMLLLILAIHALLLGFGFSFAGYCTLLVTNEAEEAEIKEASERARQQGWIQRLLLARRIRYSLTRFSRISSNWTQRSDARKYLYLGLAFLVLAAVLGLPLGAYN